MIPHFLREIEVLQCFIPPFRDDLLIKHLSVPLRLLHQLSHYPHHRDLADTERAAIPILNGILETSSRLIYIRITQSRRIVDRQSPTR